MTTRVITFPLSISNAYLLLGDRPVLVDAGSPGDEKRLLAGLREHGMDPQDLALIALAHGHTDRMGAIASVASCGTPVAVGAADAGPELVPLGAPTPGSRAILVDGGSAIAGDLIRGASRAAGSALAIRCGTTSPRTARPAAARSSTSSPASRPRSWSDTADRWPRQTCAVGSTRSHDTANPHPA